MQPKDRFDFPRQHPYVLGREFGGLPIAENFLRRIEWALSVAILDDIHIHFKVCELSNEFFIERTLIEKRKIVEITLEIPPTKCS